MRTYASENEGENGKAIRDELLSRNGFWISNNKNKKRQISSKNIIFFMEHSLNKSNKVSLNYYSTESIKSYF